MDSKIVNQFIKALTSIFAQVTNVSLTKTDLEYFPDGHKVSAKIAAILSIAGAFKGQFMLILNEPMALQLTSVVMAGVPVNNSSDLVDSAVRELCNMVAGEASKRLLEIGFNCDITFPSIARGKQIDTASPSFVSKFECEWGELQQILKFEHVSQIK
ncbi:MAG: chemotaxis protein CheX [Candidatus Riflebacteria bacterium]|nr:chemotaxis protein CheX [Candidatus Riflebacteria bacterium]